MANSVELRPDSEDADRIALSFHREGFSEFLGSLLSTPREEKKVIHCGYDVVPNDIKNLIEKLDHQVKTQNDLMHEEFGATIFFNDDSDLTVKGMANFASVDYSSRPDPVRFEVTKTYLIGFTRAEGKKSFERQVVSISAEDCNPGSFEIRVRSTEITWPPSIISLLEKEIRGLSARTTTSAPPSDAKFLFLSNFFRATRDRTDRRADKENPEVVSIIDMARYCMLACMCLIFPLTIVIRARDEEVYIFDELSRTVSRTDFANLVEKIGWRAASETAILSREMLTSGYAEYASGEGPFSRVLHGAGAFLNLYTLFVSLLVAVFVVACARRAASLDAAENGRLFLSRELISKRPETGVFTGWLAAIFAAILANILTTGILTLV